MTLLLALLIGAAPISANERVGAVVVVLAPSEVRLRLPVSALLSAAEQALGAGTSLAFRSTEQAGVDLGQLDGCDPRARYQCWLHAIEATPAIRIMITVAVLPLGPARDRFSVTALDVADVPPGFGAIEEAEETLSERALIAASGGRGGSGAVSTTELGSTVSVGMRGGAAAGAPTSVPS